MNRHSRKKRDRGYYHVLGIQPAPTVRKRKYLCPACKQKLDSKQTHFNYISRRKRLCGFCSAEVVRFDGKQARKIIEKMGMTA